jgi:hypothetical protein
MTYNKELIAGKLRRWEKYLDDYRLPAWEEIPDIGLYMEQVVTVLKQYLDYLPPELKDEQFITASTINNYVRTKVMPMPVKKKYYRTHLAYLIMICSLKQGLNISMIQKLIPGDLTVIDDTLNEDPDGAFEALRVLSQMPGRRIVVTPGLNGLGQQEAEINYALGTVMADCADTVILVGALNRQRGMRRGLIQSGFSRSNLHAVDDMDDASELLEEIAEHGDTVLFESRVPEFEEE